MNAPNRECLLLSVKNCMLLAGTLMVSVLKELVMNKLLGNRKQKQKTAQGRK